MLPYDFGHYFYVLMLFYVASVLISFTKITSTQKLVRIDILSLPELGEIYLLIG